MAAKHYTREQLQFELLRRQAFPPFDATYLTPQAASLSILGAELDRVGADDEDRGWLEWEYALAEEHYRLHPRTPFVRYVPVTVQ